MNIADIFGLTAATLTTGSFIPQLYKIVKTKSTKDISVGMFAMFLAGVICWEIYGIMIKSLPVIVANIASMIMNITIILYKIKYK